MSTKYQTTSEVPTSVLVNRLQQLGDAIPKQNRDEFSMRVPAECDRDADLVIPEAAKRLDQLQTTNQQLVEALERVKPIAECGLRAMRAKNDPKSLLATNTLADAKDAITNAKQREVS